MSTLSNNVLSEIIVHNKYSRYLKDQKRRETYEEICDRVRDMHLRKYPNPDMEAIIRSTFDEFVKTKRVLPSMRSMQFAGVPIERNPTRIYNCAYLPIEHADAFSETMFLLLSGCGVGYSVQQHHVEKLSIVKGPNQERRRRYVIGDSLEGWADAIKILVESHFHGKMAVKFDFSDIREKGSELVTSGGKAPGPGPLRVCIDRLDAILMDAAGRHLRPIEAHDMLCHIADAVLAGGIRRAAMIALFSKTDLEMMSCKAGDWWELNPQRGRANNSVILKREDTTKEQFDAIWDKVQASGSGEPGIYWTNDLDYGTNPCGEISLRPYQFCNLVEVNVSDIHNRGELVRRASAAAVIATLQAGYTNFHYLRPIWQKTTEEEALIGVGLTGIASNTLSVSDLHAGANAVTMTNRNIAEKIGINPAKRCTTVKPSGTSSIVLGCSSGIHAWHNDYYIRRMRLLKNEPLYAYMKNNFPELVEDDFFKPDIQAVLSVPQEAPKGSILRTESAASLFQRVIEYNEEWVRRGHISGPNFNNVSATISVRDDEWDGIRNAMWNFNSKYNGITVIPYDGGTYKQAPFEDITKEEFHRLEKYLHKIDLREIMEEEDFTNVQQEAACAGGVCEVNL